EYENMTVPELKAILKEAGKPVSGKKADLISRILE
ncbi:MAG TPA: SAP domain-containing protein, partial [Candidatus Thalassarchaeaceae archaeon]